MDKKLNFDVSETEREICIKKPLQLRRRGLYIKGVYIGNL